MFRSFQSRLLVLFLGLFVVILVVAFVLVHIANTRNARAQIDDALEVGSGVFQRLIRNRTQRLVQAGRLLSGDFAFKQAYGIGERGTLLSVLENHQARIGADVMILSDMDYEVIADTLRPAEFGGELAFADWIDAALDEGELEMDALMFLQGRPYQMVVVPLLIPHPDAWICIGFAIDDEFAEEFRRLTLSHVSLLRRTSQGTWSDFASTLPSDWRADLPRGLETTPWEADRSFGMRMARENYVSLVTPISGDSVVAVLQRSLREAMRPYLRLRAVLVLLFSLGVAACGALGMVIARQVSRPVLEIAASARRVEDGDYDQKLEVRQRDEIGQLAASFNHMVQGLQERDRVRNLLGKVVSPEIAQELLKSEIELGGEEREVTVLFSDVRGFTALCEGAPPTEILSRLNTYLTRMTGVVEQHQGVVDKYIGDAVMALFGAPLTHADDAGRAVATALDMCSALAVLNEEFRAAGLPELRIGVGINTARVVAGNMGSTTRLNYTVIGDGVNLASRLEGLTKQYGVPVVVSESTCAGTDGFVFRELDRVRVKGKQQPVSIFEPLGRAGEVADAVQRDVEEFHAALKEFRSREWDACQTRLRRLQGSGNGSALVNLYLDRLEGFRREPPSADWDGTFTHTSK